MPSDGKALVDRIMELEDEVKRIRDGHAPLEIGARLSKLEDYNSDHLVSIRIINERMDRLETRVDGMDVPYVKARLEALERVLFDTDDAPGVASVVRALGASVEEHDALLDRVTDPDCGHGDAHLKNRLSALERIMNDTDEGPGMVTTMRFLDHSRSYHDNIITGLTDRIEHLHEVVYGTADDKPHWSSEGLIRQVNDAQSSIVAHRQRIREIDERVVDLAEGGTGKPIRQGGTGEAIPLSDERAADMADMVKRVGRPQPEERETAARSSRDSQWYRIRDGSLVLKRLAKRK